MKQDKKERSISTLCALVLLVVFAAGILTVLLGSAGIYQRLSKRGEEASTSRTAALYLTNKIRQASAQVSVSSFGQGDALLIREDTADGEFLTRIYCHDGWLRELFTAADGTFSPEDGEKVLPLDALSLDLTGGLLTARLTHTNGRTDTLLLSPRQGEEAAP